MTLRAECLGEDARFRDLGSPGSVAVVALGRNRYDVLVCNNYVHYVTRHRLARRARLKVKRNEVLLREGLSVPDGVAVSASGRWIAVSSHNTRTILIFRNRKTLNRRSRPVGFLHGAGYPHGLRFTADDRHLLVADAGKPVIHVYSSAGDDWRGTREPAKSVRVMSEEIYRRGRTNPEEGGPKGIDVDDGMNVLVATAEHLPLAFFDLSAVLGAIGQPSPTAAKMPKGAWSPGR